MSILFEFKEQWKKEKALQKESPLAAVLKLFLLALLTTFFIRPPIQGFHPERGYAIGDIAVRDYVFRSDLQVEDSRATDRKRQDALSRLSAVYDLDLEVLTSIQRLLERAANPAYDPLPEYLEALSLDRDGFLKVRRLLRTIQLTEIEKILVASYERGVYREELQRLGENATRVTVLRNSKRFQEEIFKLQSLEELLQALRVKLEAEAGINDEGRRTLLSFFGALLKPNLSYNGSENRELLQNTLKKIEPVMIGFKKGFTLFRKGDEITPERHYLLQLIREQEAADSSLKINFSLILTLVFFLLLIMRSLLLSLQKKGLGDGKTFLVFSVSLLLSLFLARFFLMVFSLLLRDFSLEMGLDYSSFQLFYLIPFAFGPLLISFLYDFILGITFSVFNAIFLTILANFDFQVFLVFFAGGVAINFAIEYYSRLKRSSLIKGALVFLLPVNLVFIVVFHFFETHLSTIEMLVYFAFVIGAAVSAAIFATFALPIFEYVFRIVTDLKLIELTNLNLPVFREMLEKAPGTYHHSQMVASLAESAAADLNLSPLWLRAMALYHDIGKIEQPQFFTENHTVYENPHPRISPEESTKMITSHLANGIERAEKLKLPLKIRNAILTHHGTKKVKFFYEKARQLSEDLSESLFRYSGIKPQNVEDAVIMLADQVEAALKSLSSPSEQEILNVIEKIINSNIEEKQFDECEGLSFKVVNIIAGSFYRKLVSIYHQRVAYPGFDFKEKRND